MEWLKHLTEAIDYIEDHLEGEISYEEAARIACCSVSVSYTHLDVYKRQRIQNFCILIKKNSAS